MTNLMTTEESDVIVTCAGHHPVQAAQAGVTLANRQARHHQHAQLRVVAYPFSLGLAADMNGSSPPSSGSPDQVVVFARAPAQTWL